jgi:hypothetical protein
MENVPSREFDTRGCLMSHHRYTPVDELRSSSRFARERGTDVAVILHPQCEELLVDVHDESLDGLGVYVVDVEFFAVGQEVEIVYADEFFRARVRHVEPQEDGGYIVGFACERIMKCMPKEDGVRVVTNATV